MILCYNVNMNIIKTIILFFFTLPVYADGWSYHIDPSGVGSSLQSKNGTEDLVFGCPFKTIKHNCFLVVSRKQPCAISTPVKFKVNGVALDGHCAGRSKNSTRYFYAFNDPMEAFEVIRGKSATIDSNEYHVGDMYGMAAEVINKHRELYKKYLKNMV